GTAAFALRTAGSGDRHPLLRGGRDAALLLLLAGAGMPLRPFSVATLQLPRAPQSLHGTPPDRQPGARVRRRDPRVGTPHPAVSEAGGSDVHPGIVATGEPSDGVDGIVFEVTPEQLAVIDRYEEVAYRRIEVRLESGRTAFCYEPRS